MDSQNVGSYRGACEPGRRLSIVSYPSYYPSGILYNKPYPDVSFGLGGKELMQKNYLNDYFFGVRTMSAMLNRFNQMDPLCEEYYWMSPYAFCGNNPVRRTDPTGMSYSEFDENGGYLGTKKDNWWHNFWFGRTGRVVDDKEEVIQKFEFADPKNDVKDLKDRKINRIEFVQESEIISMLSRGGAFTEENKAYNNGVSDRYDYILQEGVGGGKLDFALTGIPQEYSNSSQALFLVDGVAHNEFNFGNFLFGAAGKALGLTLFELKMGAHYNSLANPGSSGYGSQLDSADDQLSIRLGVKHATTNKYKNMYYRVVVGQ